MNYEPVESLATCVFGAVYIHIALFPSYTLSLVRPSQSILF